MLSFHLRGVSLILANDIEIKSLSSANFHFSPVYKPLVLSVVAKDVSLLLDSYLWKSIRRFALLQS